MNKTKYFLGLFLLGFGALSLPTFAVPPIALNSGNVATYCTTGKGGSALLCTDSSIDSISWNTFISYPNVLDINLSNNLLSNLPNGLFSGMSSLVSINLSGNQISSIETGAFYNLPAMLNIHLDNNSIDGATLDLTTLGYFNTRQPDWQSLQVVYGCIDNILANNYNPLATQDNGTCDGNTILNSGNIGRLCGVGETDCYVQGVGITSIDEDTFVDYGDLTTLYIDDNQLSGLSIGVFSGLNNLTNLSLNNNVLTSLPDGVFSELSNLNYLYLNSNQLTSLPSGIFNGLYNLLEIEITNNPLSSLPIGLFSGLSNLNYLDINSNQITSLPKGIFSGLVNLNYLYIGYNQLSTLSSGVFNGLSGLTEIDISNNQITSVETGAFDNLPAMTYINLYNNSINGATLDATTLGYFNTRSPYRRTSQTISGCIDNKLANNYNQRAAQDNGTCDNSTILNSTNIGRLCTVGDTTCDLSNQGITSIAVNTFLSYSGLNVLYLYNNQLSNISSGVFNGLSSLTELYLYDNQITSVETGSFDNLPAMTYLYIWGNSINGAILDATTLGYFNTRSPDRRTNQIVYGCIDNKLANNYNQRATQDNGTCDSNKSLNSTNIGRICPEGSTTCYLTSQGITSIAVNTFLSYSGLNVLYLYENQLSSLPDGAFNGLTNLTHLNFDNNQIINISTGLFNGLSNLTYLSLNGNCLDMSNSAMISYLDSLGASHFDPYVCLGINYTPQTSTTGSVIGSLFFTGGDAQNRSTLYGENPDLGLLSHTWTSNGIYNFDLSAINDTNGVLWQKRGGMNTFTGKVTWIQDIIAPVFDAVDTDIESDGIIGNLDQVDISNYTAFSGLTFEKRTNPADANTAIGSITFNSALDLSDPETRSFLQDLGSRLSISSDGTISLDFRGIGSGVSLKGVGATIKFYGLDKLGFGANATSADILAKLNVYDDNGLMLDKSDLLANSGTYVGACGVGETECYVFTIGVNHFTTYKISSNTTNDNNSHGGGGGSSISKDVCVNGDYSSSYYDGSCGNQPVVVSTGVVPLVIAPKIDPISDELIAAYKRAYIKDITTMDTLSGARVQGFLTRGEMAKMIVNYAINILGKQLDTTKQASFKDLNLESQEMKGYINQAYQLGLMGVNVINFNPQGLVTRGEFATVLARLLYGEEAKGTGFYYDKPIEILRQNGVIKNTNPLMQEVRGYVMLMLMRSSQ